MSGNHGLVIFSFSHMAPLPVQQAPRLHNRLDNWSRVCSNGRIYQGSHLASSSPTQPQFSLFHSYTHLSNNQGAIQLVKNPKYHKRTKHIEMKYYLIREKYEQQHVDIFYIHTKQQLADILTKALPRELFQTLRALQGLVISPPRTSGRLYKRSHRNIMRWTTLHRNTTRRTVLQQTQWQSYNTQTVSVSHD